MLDPIFSTADLFLRDPGPRRTRVAGPASELRDARYFRRDTGPRRR